MKPKEIKYRVWDGYAIVEMNHKPTEEEGRWLRESGLLDKEGRDICECDEVIMTPLRRDMPQIRGIVEVNEERQTFYVRHGTNLARLENEWHDIEVVGNAFEV